MSVCIQYVHTNPTTGQQYCTTCAAWSGTCAGSIAALIFQYSNLITGLVVVLTPVRGLFASIMVCVPAVVSWQALQVSVQGCSDGG